MTWNSNNTNKKQLGTSHRLLMVIWLVQMLFLCVKFWPLQVIKKKKEIILLTLDWLWGHLQTDPTKACKWHKTDTFTKLGGWTYHQSCMYTTKGCLTSISDAFSAFFAGIHPSSSRITVSPTKACLLCATPAGTYQVQYPGFPKIVYRLQAEPSKMCVKRQNVMM